MRLELHSHLKLFGDFLGCQFPPKSHVSLSRWGSILKKKITTILSVCVGEHYKAGLSWGIYQHS